MLILQLQQADCLVLRKQLFVQLLNFCLQGLLLFQILLVFCLLLRDIFQLVLVQTLDLLFRGLGLLRVLFQRLLQFVYCTLKLLYGLGLLGARLFLVFQLDLQQGLLLFRGSFGKLEFRDSVLFFHQLFFVRLLLLCLAGLHVHYLFGALLVFLCERRLVVFQKLKLSFVIFFSLRRICFRFL